MYVNSSLTAQRIQKFVLVLGSFGLETATHHNPWLREKSVWVSIVQLEVSLDSGEEAGTLSGSTAPSVVNCFLLKCRKLRREDQETSDSIVGFFIEKPQADGSCSHRILILSHFYRVSL